MDTKSEYKVRKEDPRFRVCFAFLPSKIGGRILEKIKYCLQTRPTQAATLVISSTKVLF